jgi:hypothetical protein
MTARLTDALDRVYAAFADEPAPRRLEASPYKDGATILRAILSAPLRQLSPDALGPFATSALLTVGMPADYLHFLPRILECATFDRNWTGYEPVVIADRLDRCEWWLWHAERQEAVRAVFVDAFEAERDGDYPVAQDWLCGLAAMDEAVGDRVSDWIETASPAGLLQLADWRAGAKEAGGDEHPLGAFWEGIPDAQWTPVLALLLGSRLEQRLRDAAVVAEEQYRIDRAVSGATRH